MVGEAGGETSRESLSSWRVDIGKGSEVRRRGRVQRGIGRNSDEGEKGSGREKLILAEREF